MVIDTIRETKTERVREERIERDIFREDLNYLPPSPSSSMKYRELELKHNQWLPSANIHYVQHLGIIEEVIHGLRPFDEPPEFNGLPDLIDELSLEHLSQQCTELSVYTKRSNLLVDYMNCVTIGCLIFKS